MNGHNSKEHDGDKGLNSSAHSSDPVSPAETQDVVVNGHVNDVTPEKEILLEVANNLKTSGNISPPSRGDDSDQNTLGSSDCSALSTPPEELPPDAGTVPPKDPADAGSPSSKDGEDKSNKVEDVIVIQDPTFTVKIVPPGSDSFDLQVRICQSMKMSRPGVFFLPGFSPELKP